MAQQLDQYITASITGSVVETAGGAVAVADFPVPVGAQVEIDRVTGPPGEGEVIGFRDQATLVTMYTATTGVRRGNRVRLVRTRRTIRVGPGLLGRVVDAHAKPIDGRPLPLLVDRIELDREPVSPIDRPRIDAPLSTGVKAIDALLTCGRGQRLGIFAGSGVGKSVLLGMMSRFTDADVIIIALIGERGREVNEFLYRDLGPAGMKRSTVVVATSDEPALRRVQAAFTAASLAEHFRDQGKNVLLLMDSVTRLAMAQREIGLSAGEPPTTRGYPPSMFSLLPKLVERSGRSRDGSITAYFSVLVEGDDPNEPVADTMRGLLDGHIWLSRKLASRGHYPAIDVLESLSRLMTEVADSEHLQAAQTIRQLMSVYQEHEDLLSIGAYRRGSNRHVDAAIDMREAIEELLRQQVGDQVNAEQARQKLIQLASQSQMRMNAPAA